MLGPDRAQYKHFLRLDGADWGEPKNCLQEQQLQLITCSRELRVSFWASCTPEFLGYFVSVHLCRTFLSLPENKAELLEKGSGKLNGLY